MRNDGTATLTLGSVFIPAGYSLTEGLVSSLAPGAADTFTLRLDTAAAGTTPATISYAVGAGAIDKIDLSTTDLTSSANSQTALTAIGNAITDVAAQRGYLGSQINTLNSMAGVETTQSENLASASNSIMATDYTQATSMLSKYQILTQTGISALAQANSTQPAVTKLLQ